MTDQASAGVPARRTRRQLLAGGTGAVAAALTAGALARPARAAAADGDNVVLGASNAETSFTAIGNSTDGDDVLLCVATGSGIGVNGKSASGFGVVGQSRSGAAVVGLGISGTGVGGVSGAGVPGNFGLAPHGVHGHTDSAQGAGVFGFNIHDGNGVFGLVNNADASGVYGQNDGTGFGVAGRAPSGVGILGDSADGVGVWANSQNATALKVTGTAHFIGPAEFSRSGTLTVSAGQSSATQTGVTLTKASLVLATLQQARAGVWVSSAVPTVKAHSFTVHLSKAVTANTKVAWFVVN